ncbi:hypothetical protein B0H13DRAFT_2381323 [Mycena leptocephala]|nr:hypothetical protein B0H13DRAFT_2381323 [Mycena leptocephala]
MRHQTLYPRWPSRIYPYSQKRSAAQGVLHFPSLPPPVYLDRLLRKRRGGKKEDVTKDARLLRDDERARGRGAGNPRADITLRMASQHLLRLGMRSKKGNTRGRRCPASPGGEVTLCGASAWPSRIDDVSPSRLSPSSPAHVDLGYKKGQDDEILPAGRRGRPCSETMGEAARGRGAGNESCIHEAARSHPLPRVCSACAPRARKATRQMVRWNSYRAFTPHTGNERHRGEEAQRRCMPSSMTTRRRSSWAEQRTRWARYPS